MTPNKAMKRISLRFEGVSCSATGSTIAQLAHDWISGLLGHVVAWLAAGIVRSAL